MTAWRSARDFSYEDGGGPNHMLTALLASVALGASPALTMTEVDSPAELATLGGAVSSTLAAEVQRTGVFTLTTAEQTRALLSHERQRQLLGCEGDCGGQLATMFEADFLLTTKLARAGDFTLTLTLIETKTGKRQATESGAAANERALLTLARQLAVKVLSPVLKAEAGAVAVRSSEAGAEVRVDDVVMGVTPLTTSLQVAAGVHFVSLKKDGFVTWVQEVKVSPRQLSDVTARLVPSPDTLAEWEARQQRLRLGAWTTTSLAAVGVGAGVLFVALGRGAYGSEATGGFLYHRKFLLAGVETEGAVDHRALTEQYRAEVATWQTAAWLSFSVGAAAAVTATVLWLLTDDDDRYAALKPAVALTLVPGGAMGALGLSF